MILVHIEKVQGGYIVVYHIEQSKMDELQQVMKTGDGVNPTKFMGLMLSSVKSNDPLRRIFTTFNEVVEFLKELFGEP